VSRGAELARLVVHGTLHLAGLDHQHAPERRRMRARENAVMRSIAATIRALVRGVVRPRRAAGRAPAPRRQTLSRSRLAVHE
jgi:hypothetical protein